MLKDSQFYFIDDKPFVRVTQVLTVLHRPGLVRWVGSVGNDEAEVRRDQAADIGTEVHKLIVRIESQRSPILKGEWDTFSEEIKNCLRAYQQAQSYLKFRVLQSEMFLVNTEEGYAGTTDALVSLKGQKRLYDWKTGTVRDPQTKEIYPEIAFQLAAYYKAFDGDITGCTAIHLNKDTGIFVPSEDIYNLDDMDEPYQCFLGLKRVWEFLRRNHDSTNKKRN